MAPLGPFRDVYMVYTSLVHLKYSMYKTFLFSTPPPSYFLNAENTINNIHIKHLIAFISCPFIVILLQSGLKINLTKVSCCINYSNMLLIHAGSVDRSIRLESVCHNSCLPYIMFFLLTIYKRCKISSKCLFFSYKCFCIVKHNIIKT